MHSQYYASSNGFSHTRHQPQSVSHRPGNQHGFHFSRRTERVDWRKIAAVDIDHITADGDWSILQQNIQHVTYCNVDQELDLRATDPTFVKLFKLAQMIIEYLMLSQGHLGNVVDTLEQKLSKAVEAHNNATMKMNKQAEEIKQLKQENKRRKKMLASQQSFIQSNENNYHKCLYCPKAFVHVSYLQSHVDRKHPEHGTLIESQFKLANEKQELEISELREKLKMTQLQFEEEKKTYQDKLAEKEASENEKQQQLQKQQLDVIRQEQIEAQKHEMNSLRDMFMKELKEMNEKYSESQNALVDLQQRYGKTSMLGTLQDEDEIAEYKARFDEQQAKYDRLKKQLEEVTSMKSSMQQEIKKQDKDWKEKNKEVKNVYRKKISELEKALEDAQTTMDVEREGSKDEIRRHYEQQMLSMKKQSKQHEQELKAKEKEISQLQKKMKQAVDQVQSLKVEMDQASQRQVAKIQQSNDAGRRTLSPPPVIKTQAPSSTEEEETDEESEGVGKMPVSSPDGPEMYGTTTLEDSMLNTQEEEDDGDSHPNKTRIIDGMKVTLDSELSKNLQKRGVSKNADGITSRSLENKLQIMKKERQELAKKYPKFYNIREKCRRDMEVMLKDRAKGKKMAMTRPKSSVSLPPRSPSPIAKYSQRLSNTASLPRSKSSEITHQGMYGVPKTKHTAPPVAPRDSQPPPVAPRSPDVRNNVPQARSALKESFSSYEDDISSMDDDDWDSEEVSELKEISPSKTTAGGGGTRPTLAHRQDPSLQPIQSPDMTMESLSDTGGQSSGNFGTKSGGHKVNELARSIEFQLSGRKGNSKPVGGVDLSGTAGSDHLAAPASKNDSRSRSSSPQIPTIPDKFDSDEEDSFDISSLEESEKAIPKSKPQPAPRTGHVSGGVGRKPTGDTDISSNTFGTSMWGSSSKGADKGSTHGEASTAKSSLVSVTDWDDDDYDDDLGLGDL